MGDGCAKGTLLGLFDIHMNPLMIASCISKGIDHLLGHGEVVAVAEVLTDMGFDAVGALHDCFGHALVIPDALVFLALGVQKQG